MKKNQKIQAQFRQPNIYRLNQKGQQLNPSNNFTSLAKFKFLQQDLQYLKQTKDFICQIKYCLNCQTKNEKKTKENIQILTDKLKKKNQMTKLIVKELQQRIVQNRSKQQYDQQNELVKHSYQQKLQQVNYMVIQSQENVQKAETLKKKLAQNNNQTKYYQTQNSLNYYFAKGIYNASIMENISLKKKIRQKLMYYLKLKSQKHQNFYKKLRKTQIELKINQLTCFTTATQKNYCQKSKQANFRKFKILQNKTILNRKSKSFDTFSLLKDVNSLLKDVPIEFNKQVDIKQKKESDQKVKKLSSQHKAKNSMAINWFVNDCIKHSLKQIKNRNQINQLKIQKLKTAIQQVQKRNIIQKLKLELNQNDQVYEQEDQFQNDFIKHKKAMLALLEADIFNQKYRTRQSCLPFPEKAKIFRKQNNNQSLQFIKNRIKQWPSMKILIETNLSSPLIKKQDKFRKNKSLTDLEFVVNNCSFNIDEQKQRKKLQIKQKCLKKGLELTMKQKQKSENKKSKKQMMLTVSSSSQNNANGNQNQQIANLRKRDD